MHELSAGFWGACLLGPTVHCAMCFWCRCSTLQVLYLRVQSCRAFCECFCRKLALTLSDLPEVRRLCGIVKCPDCVTESGSLRWDVNHEDIKAEAIGVWLTAGKGAAVAVLAAADMTPTHLHSDCPFVGRIAHMTLACFPGDRLHLQYAVCLASVVLVPCCNAGFCCVVPMTACSCITLLTTDATFCAVSLACAATC